MKYRSDIDGLRAVAILPVVAYHTGIALVPGGFVGVDVFFVISGYLICRLIAGEIGAGSFSVVQFYKRRALRLFPALFAMFIAVSALSYLYLLPVELKDFSNSLIGAVTYVSNMFFAATTGYFDSAAETRPLLHTWSLSVEEQFYIVCPLVLMAGCRFFRTRLNLVLAFGAALSFTAAALASYRNPNFAFFLTPFRAWELLLGALVAFGFFPRPERPGAKDALGIIGLALILFAAFVFTRDTPLPLATATACAGAALVIHSGEKGPSLAGRLLSWKPVVFIGLISYSLYLWHWPIIVFQRSDSFLFGGTSPLAKAGVIAVSLAVAWASWHFIERPFRSRTKTIPARFALGGAVAGMAVTCALGVAALKLDGAPFRFPPQVITIGAWLGYNPATAFRTGHCFLEGNRQTFDAATCLARDTVRPNYLLVGDSHAAQLWLGLSSVLPEINLMQASAAACRPVLMETGPFGLRGCPRLMHFIFEDYLPKHKVDRVLLAAAWREKDIPGLIATLDFLKEHGIPVVVFGPIVEYDNALPRLLADAIRYNDPDLADRRRSAEIPALDRRLRTVVTASGVPYISMYDVMCRSGTCAKFVAGNVPYQYDVGHLTAEGSIAVAGRLRSEHALP